MQVLESCESFCNSTQCIHRDSYILVWVIQIFIKFLDWKSCNQKAVPETNVQNACIGFKLLEELRSLQAYKFQSNLHPFRKFVDKLPIMFVGVGGEERNLGENIGSPKYWAVPKQVCLQFYRVCIFRQLFCVIDRTCNATDYISMICFFM